MAPKSIFGGASSFLEGSTWSSGLLGGDLGGEWIKSWKLSISTRPWARGPANFCVGSQTTNPHEAGHLKFTHTALDRYRKHPTSAIPFRCVDCTGESTSQRGTKRPLDASTPKPDKRDDYDVNSLLRTLRQKNSWRCTCKSGLPASNTKSKHSIHENKHDPKCML